MTIIQTYEIETSELPSAVLRAFADSVRFMMDEFFEGLDIRNHETGLSEVTVSFTVVKVGTQLLSSNITMIDKSKLNALQLHLLKMLLK